MKTKLLFTCFSIIYCLNFLSANNYKNYKVTKTITVLAVDDVSTVNQNSSNNVINVLINDNFGADGPSTTHPLTFTNGSKTSGSANGGLISIENNNTPNNLNDDVIFYTPPTDFFGEDSFFYIITDSRGFASKAEVKITVLEIINANSQPIAVNDEITINAGSLNVSIDVLLNDNIGIHGYINGGLTMPNGTLNSASNNGSAIKIDINNTIFTDDDKIIYTPKTGFIGLDSFKYTITNSKGFASTATVSITIVSVNNLPTATNDSATTTKNNPVIIDVLLNDNFGTDGPATNPFFVNSPNQMSGITAVSGIFVIFDNNTPLNKFDDKIGYVPPTDFVGQDSFQYTITDANGDESTATVFITINSVVIVNGFPTATNDIANVNQNSYDNTINVSANDNYGTDGKSASHPLTFKNGGSFNASTNGGLLRIGDNGTPNNILDDVILYTPKKDFNGTDSFEYVITDRTGDASTATVTITVNASATISKPTALDDMVIVNINSINNVINVLTNDTFGLDGAIANGLTMPNGTLKSASANGGEIFIDTNATNNPTDDIIIYSPKTGFFGNDFFEYVITDASGDASKAKVYITINNISNVPIATNDFKKIAKNSSNNNINILVNDTFGLDGAAGISLSQALSNAGGTISINDNNTLLNFTDDTVVYSPVANYIGNDFFTYTIQDSTGDISTATVTISVQEFVPENPVPVAISDVITVNTNSLNNSINVLNNDTFGANGPSTTHPLTFSNGSLLSASNKGGAIRVSDNGTQNNFLDDKILFTPKTDFTGTDTFNYVITDSKGLAATATVTITVNSSVIVNLPAAVNDFISVNTNSTNNTINVLVNDNFGADGAINNGLTMSNGTLSGSSTAGGSVTINNKGTASTLDDDITFTPATGFSGNDSFTYTITDASGDSSTATVSITVVLLNQSNVPIAVDDNVTITVNVGGSIDVLANDNFGVNGPGAIPLSFAGANNGFGVSFRGGFFGFNTNQTPNNLLDDEIFYIPASNYLGEDHFDYFIRDANGTISTARVHITVVPVVYVNGTPTAVNDTASVLINSTNNKISVLANDTYGTDGINPLKIISLPNGLITDVSTNGGTITISNNNTPNSLIDDVILYTPLSNSTLTDTFNYIIEDRNGDTSTATVTITIYAVLPVPVAVTDVAYAFYNSQNNLINVLQNDDFGPDGPLDNGLSFLDGSILIASDQGGVVSIDRKNTLNTLDDVIYFTPRANYSGPDSFFYKITDASGDFSMISVLVIVQENRPQGINDAYNLNTNSVSVPLHILENDYIPSNVSFALSIINNSFGSTLVINNNGTPLIFSDDFIEFTPSLQAIQVGQERFVYQINYVPATVYVAGALVNINLTSQKTTNTLSTTNIGLDTKKMVVYPNPSKGNVAISLFSEIETNGILTLSDVTGKVIYSSQTKVKTGKNNLEFNLNVSKGVYFLKITSSKLDFGYAKIIIE
jgi:hypothetical protein